MELKSVTVNGYRNIYDTTIDFKDLTSVLSLNNYGKSNLLTSIVFGLSFIQQHPKIKQNMMNDIKCVPSLKRKDNSIFSFIVEAETTIDNEKSFSSFLFYNSN